MLCTVLCLSILFTALSVTAASEEALSADQLDQSALSAMLTLSDLPEALLSPIQEQLEAQADTQAVALDSADAESLTSLTTINADGSYTLFDYGYPVKFRENGQVKFIDHSLQKASFWKTLTNGVAYENTENSIKTYFPKKIADGVRLEMETDTLRILPVVKQNAAAALPESVSEDADILIEYPDAFGEGAHLQYAPIPTGLKENILLEAYTGQNVFAFRLYTGDLVPERTEGRWIRFVDPDDSHASFLIGESFAQDSYTGAYDDTTRHVTYDNFYTITREAEGVYLLEMEIDRDFLESAETVYPVTIDPTYSDLSTMINGTYDANITKPQSYDNDFSGQYYVVRAGDQMAYIKNYGIENYKHIDPNMIIQAFYQVYQPTQDAPSCTISLDIPWNVHNIHTVTYDTLYNDIHNFGYDTKTLPALSSQWSNTSFNITDALRSWLQYSLGEGGYTYDVGFILRATSGARIFGAAENAGVSKQPVVMVSYRQGGTVEEGIYRIRSRRTSNMVSVAGTPGNGANVLTEESNHGASQRWKITPVNNGLYTIRNMAGTNYYYLGLSSSTDSNGVNICLSTTAYKWRIIKNGNGSYRIMPDLSFTRGVNIDYSGGVDQKNLLLWSYAGGSNEQWYFDTQQLSYVNPNGTQETAKYNRDAAVNYAKQYAAWIDPNGKWDTPGYLKLEANCTNFVSQCLGKGGLSAKLGDRASDSSWFYAQVMVNYAASYTWGAADHFVLHWGHDPSGNGQQRAYKTTFYYTLQEAYQNWTHILEIVQPGDVLQTYNAEQGVHHSMIITGVRVSTDHRAVDIEFAQHTGSAPIKSLHEYLSDGRDNLTEGLIIHEIN